MHGDFRQGHFPRFANHGASAVYEKIVAQKEFWDTNQLRVVYGPNPNVQSWLCFRKRITVSSKKKKNKKQQQQTNGEITPNHIEYARDELILFIVLNQWWNIALFNVQDLQYFIPHMKSCQVIKFSTTTHNSILFALKSHVIGLWDEFPVLVWNRVGTGFRREIRPNLPVHLSV